jgi:hypothetical protein
MAEDASREPIAALASVLAMSIVACSIAWGGRSVTEVSVKNSANSRATVFRCSLSGV